MQKHAWDRTSIRWAGHSSISQIRNRLYVYTLFAKKDKITQHTYSIKYLIDRLVDHEKISSNAVSSECFVEHSEWVEAIAQRRSPESVVGCLCYYWTARILLWHLIRNCLQIKIKKL